MHHQDFLNTIYAIGEEISGGAEKIFEYVDGLINECFYKEDFSMCDALLKEIDLSKCSVGASLLLANALFWDKDKLTTYKDFFVQLKQKVVQTIVPEDDEDLLEGLQP